MASGRVRMLVLAVASVFALAACGPLYSWGSNASGQLGTGPTADQKPAQVGEQRWKVASAGEEHSCGIKAAGTLHCWGDNEFGELGDRTYQSSFEPVQVGVADDWEAVSAGGSHTCGIRTGGDLFCWGRTLRPDGSVDSVSAPELRGPKGGWEQVSSGTEHTCAIRPDARLVDRLYCWGTNLNGQLGVGDTTDRAEATPVAGSFSDVDAGEAHTCGIETISGTDGLEERMMCWGNNNRGAVRAVTNPDEPGYPSHVVTTPVQLFGVEDNTHWVEVSAGTEYSCGIRDTDPTTAGGELYCWGDLNGTRTVDPGAIRNDCFFWPFTFECSFRQVETDIDTWTAVSIGRNHACRIRSEEVLWCWGSNTDGQLGERGSRDWTDVSAGGRHTLGIG